jgi:hypothetical protein
VKKYCVDTSGLSNALENMPEDIHVTLWKRIADVIMAGDMAVTAEIYDELTHLPGSIGECIQANQSALVLEVGQSTWNFLAYVQASTKILDDHHDFISEFCGGSKKTVCINDMSIVALGKALSLPVISAEKKCAHQSKTKRHIPDVCDIENVLHMTFNDFLRAEGIQT